MCKSENGTAREGECVERKEAWWSSALLWLACGISWVASIPLLMISLGGSMQPIVGWVAGEVLAFLLFCVLVQFQNQMIAFVTVGVVTFAFALFSGSTMAFVFAAAATGLTSLNGFKKVFFFCPEFLEFQCRAYKSYHKSSELKGALDSIRPGRSFFACHPHGLLSIGWISNVVWNRKFHHAVGRCHYLLDKTLRNKGLLARIFCDAFAGPHGELTDNTRSTMQKLMAKGESLSMTPGAFQEATRFMYDRERVALKNRKGFVKYCIRYGYRLHPVYTFGESRTYYVFTGFDDIRLWLNTYGIPTVAFFGLWWLPLLPHRNLDLLTVVGEPLEIPQVDDPSDEMVDEWHGKYMDALRAVFDKHKAEAGKPDAVLEIL